MGEYTANREDTDLVDISLARDVFYIALTNTGYPIQAFSKQGTIIICVVHKDLLDGVWYFCLDQQHNILVADTRTSEIKIFSNEGKLITKFGKEGSALGEFTGLAGIAVDDLCSIVTVDEKEHNMIQVIPFGRGIHIPRPKGDYEENKRFLVCIHHFREEDIERNIEYYNGV
ncbi:Tripartite motif-containing protein 2-like [Oopsacas minuta]|uniref:Tripartite motif-containing protein 2-like n=1 Tax=Oopsacas minuta TaxID=111878 RepID=A0AAV7KFY8_9METZ|nr:Tripartite motif-containing protein 2-like [Oopsacas minuta]